jgi:hypothetical protein
LACNSADRMPTGPTARMAVLHFENKTAAAVKRGG